MHAMAQLEVPGRQKHLVDVQVWVVAENYQPGSKAANEKSFQRALWAAAIPRGYKRETAKLA